MTLDEIKDEIAKEKGFTDWKDVNSGFRILFMDEVCKRYAFEVAKENEELKAWKEAQIKTWLPIIEFMHDYGQEMGLEEGDSISEFILKGLKNECGL